MRWPWVSRAYAEAVVEERDRLRAQVDKLLDHMTRVDRTEKGLPELPAQPRRPAPQLTPRIRQLIARYGSAAIQDNLLRQAERALRKGKSAQEIERELEANAPEEDEE